MSPRRRTTIVLGSTALLAGLQLLDQGGPLRVVAAMWFVFVCPGFALAPLLPAVQAPAALIVGISLAAGVIATTALLAVGAYSAPAGLAALATVSLGGCAAQLRGAAAKRPPDEIVLLDERG